MSDQVKAAMQKQNQTEEYADYEEALQFISFMVGTEEFAVPMLELKEIIKPTEYTRVPGTPDYVLGVFNMRGSVFPLIDLRIKFGSSSAKQDNDTRYLVIQHNDQFAGFVIDKLNEAVKINQSDIEAVPETIGENDNTMQGIGKKEDRLITILRVEALLKRTF